MATSAEPELFNSGIQTENSDIRAHVGFLKRVVFVFKTRLGLEAMNATPWPERPASQPGVNGHTARGKLVLPSAIKDIRELKFKPDNPIHHHFDLYRDTMTTTEKGRLAVDIVILLMKWGRFPVWMDADEDERQNIQIKGTDIVLFCKKRVQVKCDYLAGAPNLYLQIAERNPLKRF